MLTPEIMNGERNAVIVDAISTARCEATEDPDMKDTPVFQRCSNRMAYFRKYRRLFRSDPVLCGMMRIGSRRKFDVAFRFLRGSGVE